MNISCNIKSFEPEPYPLIEQIALSIKNNVYFDVTVNRIDTLKYRSKYMMPIYIYESKEITHRGRLNLEEAKNEIVKTIKYADYSYYDVPYKYNIKYKINGCNIKTRLDYRDGPLEDSYFIIALLTVEKI